MSGRIAWVLLIGSTACSTRAVPDCPYVAELELRGVHNVNTHALRKGLACKPASRWRSAATQPFDEIELARDRLRIQRYYERNGYYAARVTLAEARPRPHGGLDVVIAVQEGAPTLVGDVRLFGFADVDDATKERIHKAQLGMRRGQVFVHADYEKFKATLLRILRDSGYPNADITGVVDVMPADNQAHVILTATPGAAMERP